jgi:hypothetical protein
VEVHDTLPARKDQKMAIPKKAGLRKVKVGTIAYYWTFKADYAIQLINIGVGEVENRNKTLLIQAYYNDPWLTFGETLERKNEIDLITPGFIKQAIDFALVHGWNNQENKVLNLGYENKAFCIKDKD